MSKVFGGIEAGGTKFVCAIGTGPEDLLTSRFPTTTFAETLGHAIAFFRDTVASDRLAAIGIASFGPVDLDPQSRGMATSPRHPSSVGRTPIS